MADDLLEKSFVSPALPSRKTRIYAVLTHRPYPTREQILALFNYDPRRGVLTRKPDNAPSGIVQGTVIADFIRGDYISRGVLIWIIETGSPPGRRLYYRNGGMDARFSQLSLTPHAKPRNRIEGKYPTREQILAELSYDRDEGTFTRRRTGEPSVTYKNGYAYDYVAGRQVPRSILVWIIETGEEPAGRIRFLRGPDDTRFRMLALCPRRTKKRNWTAEDSDNLQKNRAHFAEVFAGRTFAKERDFAWAVALLS